MDPFGIGLVGLGRHGMRYATHLLRDIPGATLVGVCRRNVPEGNRFRRETGVPFFQDYRDLIKAPPVQVLVVATPPSLNRDICRATVKAGKPILIEKPLAPSTKEAREMVFEAHRSGVPLMTAHTLRFEPAVQYLRSVLHSTGRPQHLHLKIQVEPRPHTGIEAGGYAGRGVLLELGIHVFDLVRFLTGEEVQKVSCTIKQEKGNGPERHVSGTLYTTQGMGCTFDVSRLGAGRVGCADWTGTHGRIHIDWIRHWVVEEWDAGGRKERSLQAQPTIVAVVRAFLAALREGTPLPVTGLDGQRAVEIVDACYQSAHTNRRVVLTNEE